MGTAKPDVLVGTPAIGAVILKHATSTIPIVGIAMINGARLGLFESLSHPGGNVTGTDSVGAAMKRREFITLLGGAVATWPLAAHAQQAKNSRIGVLSFGRGDKSDASLTTLDAFVPALRELGYIEGQSIGFDRRFADGDATKLDELAQQLVEQRVDAIVALSTPAVRAARRATSTIPIVGIGMADPVEDGLASSLGRPKGNVTGTTFLGPELVSKRLQLLKEIVPGLSRVVVLWHPRAYGEHTMAGMLKEIESAAQSLGTRLQLVPVDRPADLDGAFAAMAAERADALIVFPSPMLFSQYARIVTFAANSRLPAMYAAREAVDLGGLVSYGVNLPGLSRATATYLDRILKGAKPAELPIQQPTKLELVINLKTARALGLTANRDFLLIADEVIE
ncbi:ABC transporter substrate-binding protein [Bradyrhizobium sp. Ec3.3]|uniref:ABC transporter substrate-binding protein n=1 Tax=Bradyrhizobium sp. Ec3.3 TaxID=189753 RepID=UPI002737B8BE|nr:ABC transporter substrate-binding protein [Bradyrhizobium sp. Ec3.3]